MRGLLLANDACLKVDIIRGQDYSRRDQIVDVIKEGLEKLSLLDRNVIFAGYTQPEGREARRSTYGVSFPIFEEEAKSGGQTRNPLVHAGILADGRVAKWVVDSTIGVYDADRLIAGNRFQYSCPDGYVLGDTKLLEFHITEF